MDDNHFACYMYGINFIILSNFMIFFSFGKSYQANHHVKTAASMPVAKMQSVCARKVIQEMELVVVSSFF